MTRQFLTQEKLFWLIFLLSLAPFIFFACRLSANSDVLWLGIAMDRILHGGTMTQNVYEGNPPLNLTSALVPLLLSKTGISYVTAVMIYIFAAIALAVAATRHILRVGWPDLAPGHRTLIAAGFALGGTIFTSGSNLAERDHLIALGLVPFMLLQIAITDHRAWPRRAGWAVLVIATYLILLKPCYGLLPTLLLLHRAVRRRSLRVVFDPDFLALAGATILCPLLSYLLFPDWFQNILPDVAHYYVTLRDPHVAVKSAWLVFVGVGALAAHMLLPQPAPSRRLGAWLALGAIVNVAAFYAQGRDYYYHLLPSAAFFAASIATLIYPPVAREGGARFALFGGGALLTGMAYALIPIDTGFITARQYESLPMTRLVATCDGMTGKPCPFFLFNDGQNVPWETAYYAHTTLATRGGSYWWLPGLMQNPSIPAEKRLADRGRFARMVGEDLDRGKPPLVMIGQFDFDGKIFDFPGYFGIDPTFRAAWSHYRLERQFVWNRVPYGGQVENPLTVPVNVYHRLPD